MLQRGSHSTRTPFADPLCLLPLRPALPTSHLPPRRSCYRNALVPLGCARVPNIFGSGRDGQVACKAPQMEHCAGSTSPTRRRRDQRIDRHLCVDSEVDMSMRQFQLISRERTKSMRKFAAGLWLVPERPASTRSQPGLDRKSPIRHANVRLTFSVHHAVAHDSPD